MKGTATPEAPKEGTLMDSVSVELCLRALLRRSAPKAGALLHRSANIRNIIVDHTTDDSLSGMLSLVFGKCGENLTHSTQRTIVGLCQCKAMFVHPEGVLLLAECQARATLQST